MIFYSMIHRRGSLPGRALALMATLLFAPPLAAGELRSALERLAESAAEFEGGARSGADADVSVENRAAARVAYLLGRRRGEAGDFPGARQLFETAALLDARPEYYVALAESYERLSLKDNTGEKLQAARTAYETALGLARGEYGETDARTSQLYARLGLVLLHMGRAIEATGYLQRALYLDRKLLARFTQSVTENTQPASGAKHTEELRRRIGALLHNLGAAYHAAGAYDQAIQSYEEALALDAGEGEPPATATTARRYNNMAAAYDRLGEHAQAIEYYEKALTILKAGDVPDSGDGVALGVRYNNLGLALANSGDTTRARERYEQALAIFTERLGEEHEYTQIVHRNMERLEAKNEAPTPNTEAAPSTAGPGEPETAAPGSSSETQNE